MRSQQKQFLFACIGYDDIGVLAKSLVDGHSLKLDLDEIKEYLALMIVPQSLLAWLKLICRDDNVQLPIIIPGSLAKLKFECDKAKDLYSGYIETPDRTCNFKDCSVLRLAAHIAVALGLQNECFCSQKCDHLIRQLNPLIEQLVTKQAQTIVNINLSNIQPEVVLRPVPFIPELPVVKEEIVNNAVEKSDPYQAGYYMTLGNYYRTQNMSDLALQYDSKLEKHIQAAKMAYSDNDYRQFDEGIQCAIQYLRDSALVKNDTKQELIQSVLLDNNTNILVFDIIDRALGSLVGKKDSITKITMSKTEMEAKCPDCGEPEFKDGKFVGCVCMTDLVKAKLKVIKNENGTYQLQFGKGWDQENIQLLLRILKNDLNKVNN